MPGPGSRRRDREGRGPGIGARLLGAWALLAGCAGGPADVAPGRVQGGPPSLRLAPAVGEPRRPDARPVPAPARAGGAVTGRVAAFAGGAFRPVPGVRVEAPGGAVATTDGDGRYVLAGVPAGEQVVRLRHPGFAPAEHPVVVIPGVGTPRAHVLLMPPGYGLRQAGPAAPFDAEVSGVVYDPRGAALGGATVTITCPRALGGRGTTVATTTDAEGFFAASLGNVAPDGVPAEVSIAAAGTTPGGVPVRTLAPATAALAGQRLALNVQALGFPDPGAPVVVGGAFVAGGAEAAIAAENLSARADEYYLELASGADTFDALPLTVGAGQATFRVPEALPDTLFAVRVVPFGRPVRRSAPSPAFVTVYGEADLETDLGFEGVPTLVDLSEATGSVNAARFMAGDVARLELALTNANARIAPVVDLFGYLPPGSVGVSASVDGASVPLDGPDAFGFFRIAGIAVPTGGRTAVRAEFRSALAATNANAFGPTRLGVQMPATGLTKPTGPAEPAPLAVAGVDTAGFGFAKAIQDDGTPGNGKARVVLTLLPGASLAGAAYKITDATRTEVGSTATAALFTGTADLPAAGVALGLSTSDVLDLKIDGLAAPQVKVFGPAYDVETLIGQINATDGLAGKVKASRVGGKFVLERLDQGAGKTLEILATAASARMRGALGLPTGLRQGGCQADFTAATATQPNGTPWSVTASGVAWSATTGQASATIVLRPPAAFAPGDGPGSPITLTYDLLKLNGAAATFGGGTGATVGPKAVSYNLVPPYTSASSDRAFVRSGGDAAAASGL